ncbi:MAG: hypothetical protein IPI13_18040 [Actinomycetales bacterium]|uniref:Uncharacterized protein n=1 Tax=Candidatus Phosphoribacter hodrii TaxID=2953743 RepID=A0A935IPJ1_9MICO|nr:hypothetical protein [Candidatus Phosphoribacter hodrii]
MTTTLPEPTHAEVIRRLDAIATDLKSLNDRLDSTYVRRDVHDQVHRNTETALAAKADRDVVNALKTEVEEMRDLGRRLVFAVVAALLGTGGTVAWAVVQRFAGG